ncbi:two pore domain potassium channel family protein [Pseudoxanthomonas sp. CAU 1598]|uniref:Two pore domain potassium channel family protein n=2 Tax=Pseudomarimonas arenosa TaxID=2774145 RepID=A0AAW3ZN68_9GAMM|nr:two pore domain potassium channel family protein [Pseudomarimonas arenosa]
MAHTAVVLATAVLVLAAAGIHYEGLNYLARRLSRREGPRRPRVLYAVLGALLLHIAEIWMFGFGIWGLLHFDAIGYLQGSAHHSVLEAVYLSATTYSTLGFGDLVPVGPIRFVIGTEALLGLLMITWSASFTYLEMERNWRER